MNAPSSVHAWRAFQGFWNLDAGAGAHRLIACWRFGGGSPGPRDEWASEAVWGSEAAQELTRRMLGLGVGSTLLNMFNPGACWRALSLAAVLQSAPEAEFAETTPDERASTSGKATARFLAFDREGCVSLAAGFERLAATCGAVVRHSHPELAEAAQALARSMGPLDFDPALGAQEVPGVNAERDLFFLVDPRDRSEHVFDMRGCAMELGVPSRAALALPSWLATPGSPSLLSPNAVKDAVEALGEGAFSLSARLRLDAGIDWRRSLQADALGALQEALAISEQAGRPARVARAPSL